MPCISSSHFGSSCFLQNPFALPFTMSMTPRWSRKKPHFPSLAVLLLVFIACSIPYNEFGIQQIHESPDHVTCNQQTSFTYVKPNLPKGASGLVIHLQFLLSFFTFWTVILSQSSFFEFHPKKKVNFFLKDFGMLE